MKNWYNQIIGVGCLLALVGGNIIWTDIEIVKSGAVKQAVQYVQNMSEQKFFPYLSEKSQTKTDLGWEIWERALSMMPMGSYVLAQEEIDVEDEETYLLLAKLQENDEILNDDKVKKEPTEKVDLSIKKLKNFDYLISKFYTVDSVTYVKESDFKIEEMLEKNLKMKKEEGPKILIFHTHSQEKFADSSQHDGFSIVNAGDYLEELLEDTYGIETMHHKGVYDKINGRLDRSQAYERARPEITQILKENPTIEVVIDLHRDGVGNSTHLATEINGKDTAQIMFFNGMCRTRTNGDLAGMANPYLKTNLTFSLQMKIAAETYYPGFTRRNYLKGYKYNMDLAPKMLLIEAGAQTNTVEEIKNAMEPLAEILHLVVGY